MGREGKKWIGPLFAGALAAAASSAEAGPRNNEVASIDVPVVCTPEHPLIVWKNSVPVDMYPPFSETQREIARQRFENFIGCHDDWKVGSDSEAAAQTTAINAGDVRVKGHPYFGKVKGYNRKTGVTRMW